MPEANESEGAASTILFDEETGEHYWISGPKKNGEDGLYGYRPVPIDEDVREEYWVKIRGMVANQKGMDFAAST